MWYLSGRSFPSPLSLWETQRHEMTISQTVTHSKEINCVALLSCLGDKVLTSCGVHFLAPRAESCFYFHPAKVDRVTEGRKQGRKGQGKEGLSGRVYICMYVSTPVHLFMLIFGVC